MVKTPWRELLVWNRLERLRIVTRVRTFGDTLSSSRFPAHAAHEGGSKGGALYSRMQSVRSQIKTTVHFSLLDASNATHAASNAYSHALSRCARLGRFGDTAGSALNNIRSLRYLNASIM